MKYKIQILCVLLNFVFACNTPEKQENQKDSVENVAVQKRFVNRWQFCKIRSA